MAEYSKGAKKSVASAMNRMEKGTLRSGKSTKKVTNTKQAIAIGLAEAKTKGAKVPEVKKSAAKKSVSKKIVSKKSVSKKVGVKNVAAKKPVVNKSVTKKTVTKKSAVKNTAPQKSVPVNKKAVAKKQAIKKRVKENTNLPVPTALLEELTHQLPESNEIINPVKDPSGSALTIPVKIEDPLTSFDKHVYHKATTKGDPHSKLHLSSVNKSTIRPSGKKPLWRK